MKLKEMKRISRKKVSLWTTAQGGLRIFYPKDGAIYKYTGTYITSSGERAAFSRKSSSVEHLRKYCGNYVFGGYLK